MTADSSGTHAMPRAVDPR